LTSPLSGTVDATRETVSNDRRKAWALDCAVGIAALVEVHAAAPMVSHAMTDRAARLECMGVHSLALPVDSGVIGRSLTFPAHNFLTTSFTLCGSVPACDFP
jgi:hypothetical protein